MSQVQQPLVHSLAAALAPRCRMRTDLLHELKQGSRFVVLGTANSLLSVGLYWVLQHTLPLVVAYSVAYGAGIALSATMSGRFVFRVRTATRQKLVVFLANLTVFGLSLGFVALLQDGLGLSPLVAGAGSVCVSAPLNYLVGRRILAREQHVSSSLMLQAQGSVDIRER